ncbi:nitrate ABC transporter permease [Thiomicrospira sp. XS5]|uniref:ABC transporter permease n=1 Tax=unclassified Thiomicrospira TaxID=2643099 RepID=UPI0004A6DED7|nr:MULTISPECIES: ABC transporter permease [unclassified Thiomicrospira]AZR81409.1 nitrate ABC transporter permease [Thiomicrospira sp. S5]AZR81578.1 nitrate ABC transporter permease [Thiomicrospira sp. S5]KUJ75537.1 nitrate ABC transporter permease [Thiomicrospira sp. XS5]
MALFSKSWTTPRVPLDKTSRIWLTFASFAIPILLWSLVSYSPYIWHPQMKISDPGDVSYFRKDSLIDKEIYYREMDKLLTKQAEEQAEVKLPQGVPSNPVYLPAPHEVLTALYTAFTTPPKRSNEPWFHESLGHSIQVIAWGFFWSMVFGLPLGILAGTYESASRVIEPFTEFFRYLPAPAFGALAVAILGIYDAPKIAIIFIGTFFQMVLITANTTRKLNMALIEASLTLGCKGLSLIRRVIIPGILPDLYRDMRILLGWAWTYLIVAELIGTSSGITWFITQQARYKNFDNVFAAILIIGIIGLVTDLVLARIGKRLFPWHGSH